MAVSVEQFVKLLEESGILAAEDSAKRRKSTVAGTTGISVEDMDTTDARTDIYSLACTLFYLLTGKQPYNGDSSTSRTLAHQNQPIPSLRALCPEVSESLAAVFGRMTDKNVDHRYQTMADAAADLERCL